MKGKGLAICLVIILPQFAAAQPAAATTPPPVDIAVPDIPFPESPAAAALSRESDPILRPSTVREFAASLITLTDRTGKFSPGISLAVAPAQLIGRRPVDYAKNPLKRALFNTQISLATVADQTAGAQAKAQRIALGLRIPIFDLADPALATVDNAFIQCRDKFIRNEVTNKGLFDDIESAFLLEEKQAELALKKNEMNELLAAERNQRLIEQRIARAKRENKPVDVSDTAELAKVKERVLRLKSSIDPVKVEITQLEGLATASAAKGIVFQTKAKIAMKACADLWFEFVKQNPQATHGLHFAVAQTWTDVGTSKADLQRDARYLWLTYRGGFSESQRYLLQAKQVRSAIEAGTTPVAERRYDGNQVAARYLMGRDDTWNFLLTGGYEKRKYEVSGKTDKVRSLLLGADFKFMEDKWFRVNVGREHKSIGGSQATVNATFDWGFSAKPIEVPF